MAAIAPSMANINLEVVAPYEVTISIAIITATAVFIVLNNNIAIFVRFCVGVYL